MTRIIGGIAGSRVLASPAKVTRPTSDRIRESIFNRLDALNLIENAKVLDLYAGTGALGLEAASRGAKQVVLVEQHKQALGGIIQNMKMIKAALLKEGVEVDLRAEGRSVQSFLNTSPAGFNLVFIDPPYELSNQELEGNLNSLVQWLEPEAVVVLERSSRSAAPSFPAEFNQDETKSYGDTEIYWLSVK
ncbi:MAG: 16S rRNA (guanine(966)-N(2))-methyltransferase RsmD [Micrococcales bacterium]|nr:16S rRNA (guanine(966)-N(2))-methyltransferase RsmD [Micrococcales bacterium]NBR55147.1 16S rRNA (guanine(966)-N(2))-methyltransferase RsmD [Micrococcales bacterium]NBR61397.1 16S rRNA (guanine(966)-N(2))-methyltransferase RsmD [Actinomycetota bacterium]NBT47203.1 16S rRNA (guanine(966)-N(2))-methyltransferase RsmD [Actinomycetota bacterium]NBY44216.1 16S rRNA (guanine(966)-N(2))-methyltransferase RsmD [Micrococcales bacterium]